jgi:3-hydroxybutyryl-CoA dehydrogenase
MTFDANRSDLTVGVLGAGAMGRGIAQVAAGGGMRVLLMDTKPGMAAEAKGFIGKMFDRAAEKGQMSSADAAAATGRVEVAESMAAFAPCHLVIEAIVENLAIKQQTFAELEQAVSPDCILATNTSSLSVTTISAKLKTAHRFAGFHFFNPVPLMKLVEVIDGVQSAPWVGDALMVIGKRMTREPVRCVDVPGFIVNQVGRGFTIEAAHMLQESLAGIVDIDRVMRDVGGFRMGPFELMELTGLDVTHPASEAIYQQFYDEPRYRPVMLMRARAEAGILGRKTRRGWYDYDAEMKPIVAPEAPAPDARPASVWVSAAEPHGHAALSALLEKLGASVERGDKPSAQALILVTPYGTDATHCAVEQGLDAKRTVAVDTLFPLVKRRTIMGTPVTDPAMLAAAQGLLASDGTAVTVLRDSPGFIAQRIVAMICNIGCSIAQMKTASPADIDKAVTLGLNYPNGPLRFGDVVGVERIHAVLSNMHRIYGDPRYRPNVWMTRRARLGVSLLTPE